MIGEARQSIKSRNSDRAIVQGLQPRQAVLQSNIVATSLGYSRTKAFSAAVASQDGLE